MIASELERGTSCSVEEAMQTEWPNVLMHFACFTSLDFMLLTYLADLR